VIIIYNPFPTVLFTAMLNLIIFSSTTILFYMLFLCVFQESGKTFKAAKAM